MKIVVYTAIMGSIDRLWSVLPGSADVQHVAFVDAPKQEVGLWGGAVPDILDGTDKVPAFPTWEQRVVPVKWGNRRTARHYKALPHRYLPDADAWIWVDGNVRLRIPPEDAMRMTRGPLTTFDHPDRKCLYVEGAFCRRVHKDKAMVIDGQLGRYRSDGMPPGWGLASTRVVIRRNVSKAVELNEAWWHEIERHSLRDQISLPYVCWKDGMRWAALPGKCDRENASPHWLYIGHTK